jgi:iron(III) transport system substrate-binding protein
MTATSPAALRFVKWSVAASLLAAVVMPLAAMLTAGPAAAQTAAEKLYAELATLPAAERQARIEEGAKKEGTFNFIHTWRGSLARQHVQMFEKRYPFLKVDFVDIGSQDAAERLVAEETVGRHLTDVVSMAVPDLVDILDKNLVAKYPTPAAEKILPQYKGFADPDNRWLTFYWSEFGLTYNTDLVKEADAPKTWDDLCKPMFKGQVSFDPPTVRFLVGVYTMMGDAKMQEWTKCIGKNKPIIARGHTQRMELMIAGDHMVQGQNYMYTCYEKLAKAPNTPCKGIFTAPVLGLGGAVVINKNTQHPYASALFADWTLSEESQAYTGKNFRGPVAIKHPFIPEGTKITTYGIVGNDVVEKSMKYWDDNVTKVN